MSKTVLVVGGAGYIGSHACKALSDRGYEPVVFDNLSTGHEWAVRWGSLEKGDLLDPARIETVLRRTKPAGVIHFAAFSAVGESVREPDRYYRNNVSGTLNLLNAMKATDVRRLIFSSTAAVYGMPETMPIAESASIAPINPYGASKMMVERMLADFHQAFGLDSVALRYFNAAGAEASADIGESHDPETHLIPLVLDALIGKRPNITVFGDDYPTEDGTCIRDYIHVTDLADAHVRALEWLQTSPGAHAMNLGNGAGFSVMQIIQAIEEVTGRSVPYVMGERREGDPAVLISDSTWARETLGWGPQHADIHDIVASAWDWHERHNFGNTTKVVSQ